MLNLEGHSNCITASIVTVILLKGKDLHIGWVASGRVCSCSLRSRRVFNKSALIPWLCKKDYLFQGVLSIYWLHTIERSSPCTKGADSPSNILEHNIIKGFFSSNEKSLSRTAQFHLNSSPSQRKLYTSLCLASVLSCSNVLGWHQGSVEACLSCDMSQLRHVSVVTSGISCDMSQMCQTAMARWDISVCV